MRAWYAGQTKCPENLQLLHFTSMVCFFNSRGPKKAQGDANFKAGWARGQESDSLHEGQGLNMFSGSRPKVLTEATSRPKSGFIDKLCRCFCFSNFFFCTCYFQRRRLVSIFCGWNNWKPNWWQFWLGNFGGVVELSLPNFIRHFWVIRCN